MQKTGTLRTCKHVRELLGEEKDKERLSGVPEAEPTNKRKGKAAAKKKKESSDDEEEKGPVRKGCGSIEVMLAHPFDPEKHVIDGWLMSEKLDGVRCFWDGATMYTRNKKLFYPPKWFKKLLPAGVPLDGELWTKRDDFQRCVSIVRR